MYLADRCMVEIQWYSKYVYVTRNSMDMHAYNKLVASQKRVEASPRYYPRERSCCSEGIRPISLLTLRISEGLTPA